MKVLKVLQADAFIKNNIGTDAQRKELIKIAQDVKTKCHNIYLILMIAE